MRKTASLLLAAGLLALLAGGIAGQSGQPQQPSDKEREADREAIRKSAAEFVLAFDKGDAKAIAAQWTEQGEYHEDSGELIRGRAAIEKAYAEHFKAMPKGKMEAEVRAIRFIGRDAALEEGVLQFKPAGAELPSTTFYTALHLREDGKWKIGSVRESGTGYDKLEDLAWLIGTWTAKAKDRELHATYEWNPTKTQIRSQFSVKEDGKVTSSGTQTIAWDPQSGQLRSWLHDDEGGHGQALWFRDGNRWVLDALGALPDGRETSAANIITRLNDDEFLWRSTKRSVEGRQMPDVEPVKLTRVKAGK